MAVITKESELGQAIQEEQDSIEIEGDLANKVIKIKAIDKEAWSLAIAAIGVAVALVLTTPAKGGLGVIALPALAPAVGLLGSGPAVAAVGIAVSGGGVGALSSLRKYELIEHSKIKVTLVRK